jgi:hypothetical protein
MNEMSRIMTSYLYSLTKIASFVKKKHKLDSSLALIIYKEKEVKSVLIKWVKN